MPYLLDTNHCVYLINGLNKRPERRKPEEQKTIENLLKIPDDVIYVSEATIGELIFGAERSKLRGQNIYNIEVLKRATIVLPVDIQTWEIYGKTKATLSHQGKIISDIDLLIACIAKQHSLILVSNDQNFKNLPADFQIENWTS